MMRRKNNKLVILNLMIFISVILMISYTSTVKGAPTELKLNEPRRSVWISQFDANKEYKCSAPSGNLQVRVTGASLFAVEFSIVVAKDTAYTQILGKVDNSGGKDVNLDISLASALMIYINMTWISGGASFDIVVSDNSGLIMNIVWIALAVGLGALSVLGLITGKKKAAEEIKKLKYEYKTDKPIPKTYKFLLKHYSSIPNLNILNAIENKSIETELKQTGIGYYTTTHHSYSSSGHGHSYTSTRPYTYVIRYNSLIELAQHDSKTQISMKLKSGKHTRGASAFTITMLVMAIFFGIFFSFMPFIGTFWYLPVLIMLLIALPMSFLMPRMAAKGFKRVAEDQFQLLIKKPIIAMQLGTEDAKQALQIAPVEKKVAKMKATARFCPFCGNTVLEGTQICENCGSELD